MISANAIPVLEALEGERGQSVSSGTSHFGVTNTALEQYKKEHRKENDNKINNMTLEALNADPQAAKVVRDEYFDYLEDKLNSKGNFYSYSKNERDGILLEVYNTGIKGSPRLVEAVRDGKPIEEVALAMLTGNNGKYEPNPNEDLSKYNKNKLGRLNRLYTEIKMMFNPDYEEINTREDLDKKRTEWGSKDMTSILVKELTSIQENNKILNEQTQQISSCISNYSLPKEEEKQTETPQQASIPDNNKDDKQDKAGFFTRLGKEFVQIINNIASPYSSFLQNSDKNAINKAGANINDGNTNNNMQ